MAHFVVSIRGGAQVTVEAGNWLVALGNGLEALGGLDGLDRLACEVLGNGTVLARDVRSGTAMVVRPTLADPAALEPTVDALLLGHDTAEDDDDSELFVGDPDDTLDGLPADDGATERTETVPGLSHTRDEDEVWGLALAACRQRVPCEAGSALRSEPGGGLRFVATAGSAAHQLRGVSLPPGRGLASVCATQRVGLLVNDPQSDRRFYRALDESTGFATRSVLCVPVVAADRVWGCIQLLNARSESFSRADLAVLDPVVRAVAAQLSRLRGA